VRDWSRYAKALDMRLEGKMLKEIAVEFGVSKERARQMVLLAKQQLAFRVFRGVPRPLPPPRY
jgi:DNA-directed RNA polymerase sigma subunit (sigma70/sigma32)